MKYVWRVLLDTPNLRQTRQPWPVTKAEKPTNSNIPYPACLFVHHTFHQIPSQHQFVIHVWIALPDNPNPWHSGEKKYVRNWISTTNTLITVCTLSWLSFCTPNLPPNPLVESVCELCWASFSWWSQPSALLKGILNNHCSLDTSYTCVPYLSFPSALHISPQNLSLHQLENHVLLSLLDSQSQQQPKFIYTKIPSITLP